MGVIGVIASTLRCANAGDSSDQSMKLFAAARRPRCQRLWLIAEGRCDPPRLQRWAVGGGRGLGNRRGAEVGRGTNGRRLVEEEEKEEKEGPP